MNAETCNEYPAPSQLLRPTLRADDFSVASGVRLIGPFDTTGRKPLSSTQIAAQTGSGRRTIPTSVNFTVSFFFDLSQPRNRCGGGNFAFVEGNAEFFSSRKGFNRTILE
jgi:hypothetical protein